MLTVVVDEFTFNGVHVKVAPAVVDDPFNVTELTAQVIVWFGPALTFGTTVFCVIATTELLVHPLTGLVTVKV